MTKIDVPDWLTNRQHVPRIDSIGWGEPLTFYPKCSCGWEGIVIGEPYFNPTNPTFDHYPEPLRTIARTYGPDSLLDGKSAYGTRRDAEVQVLHHLGYDPDVDRAKAAFLLNTMSEHLATVADALTRRAPVEATGPSRAFLKRALSDVDDTYARINLWGNGAPITLPDRHPEAVRILDEFQAEQDAARKAAEDRPFTPGEKRALRDAGIDLPPDA